MVCVRCMSLCLTIIIVAITQDLQSILRRCIIDHYPHIRVDIGRIVFDLGRLLVHFNHALGFDQTLTGHQIDLTEFVWSLHVHSRAMS